MGYDRGDVRLSNSTNINVLWETCGPEQVPVVLRDRLIMDFLAVYMTRNHHETGYVEHLPITFQQGTQFYEDTEKKKSEILYRIKPTNA